MATDNITRVEKYVRPNYQNKTKDYARNSLFFFKGRDLGNTSWYSEIMTKFFRLFKNDFLVIPQIETSQRGLLARRNFPVSSFPL